VDPWGSACVYHVPGRHNVDYDLLSIGPDGKEGTADDIGNWQ
jgi:general secretion pathway protein G